MGIQVIANTLEIGVGREQDHSSIKGVERQGKTGINQPTHHGYRVVDIENWSPKTDPYADLLRARIPLQKRNKAFAPTQANPNLSPITQLYNLTADYNDEIFRNEPYTNEFARYVYNFWQYTDYYGAWHGMVTPNVPDQLLVNFQNEQVEAFEFGMLNVPNAAYTNAAHKNGVKSCACLFIPRQGQAYDELLKKDDKGEFIIAKKLIEMREYFGFDGYFINQETNIDSKHINVYKAFTKQLVDAGIHTQWYDTIDDIEGKLTYKPSLIESHSSYVKDDHLGRVNNAIFMNYNWNSKDGWNNGDSTSQNYISETVAESKRRGLEIYESVFLGVEAGEGKFDGGHNSTRNMDVILDLETGNPLASIGLLGVNFIQKMMGLDETGEKANTRIEQNDYQWAIAERERMFYTGVRIDPTNTDKQPGYSREDIGVKDASQWTGISRYITERSVVNGSTFATCFNTGHGMEYRINGEVVSDMEWSHIGIQDLLPTWQWWIESEGTKLQVDFDYGDKVTQGERFTYRQMGAYRGGNSLVVNGMIDADNFLHLYKTELIVKENSKASVKFFKVSESDDVTMQLGLIFEDAPHILERIDIPNTDKQTRGYVGESVDLKDFSGRVIAAIGLIFKAGKEVIQDYQMNIGELKVTDGENHTPAKPTGYRIKDIFNTGEMYLTWDIEDYESVRQYNIYAELEDGKEEFLGATYDEIYYVKQFNAHMTKLKLRALGTDGTESEAAEINFRSEDYVKVINVVETKDGLDLSWLNPEKDFVKLRLDLSFTDGRKDTYIKEVDHMTTFTQFEVPVKEGDKYLLRVSTLDDLGEVITTISVTGKMKDIYSAPYEGKYYIKGEKLALEAPKSKDWHHMYVYINDVLQKPSKQYADQDCDYRIRGYHDLDDIELPRSGDVIKVILEDYEGNRSVPISYTFMN